MRTEEPLRRAFQDELDQLRLQVEVMGVRVDQNLERMRQVLDTGDLGLARLVVAADDDIDAMNVSLTERCHDLLAREQPVASDLRFVVSVLRILGELERVGDLALRVAKRAPELELIARHEVVLDLLRATADHAVEQYRTALRAWSAQDLGLATALVTDPARGEQYAARLAEELQGLRGPDAVRTAIGSLIIGRSLDRIADHAAIVGARLRYLISGDPDHLAAEVR